MNEPSAAAGGEEYEVCADAFATAQTYLRTYASPVRNAVLTPPTPGKPFRGLRPLPGFPCASELARCSQRLGRIYPCWVLTT